ncbi:MAG: hypothetical protein GY705_27055, partial [Bacteroidetes bacterium]|nr:hypothetical protein [Bacteroidota bacterium]
NNRETPGKHPGNTRETPGKHPENTQENTQLANTIMKKRKDTLSPLTHLDKRTIKYISDACGAPVSSQDLASSQNTKQLIFQEVESIITQYVIDNCAYCRMQVTKFS